MRLSKRLQQVADFVPNGVRFADIGSDHAYLPVYLAESGRIHYAVAGEINDGPFESAKRTVEETGYGERIDVRKGNGLAVLKAGEVNVIAIAGMGGGTIVEILSAGRDKLAGVTRLILQPMVDGDRLRRWLHTNGWRIVEEEIVLDDQILYEILAAEPGAEMYDNPLWYEIGNVELLKDHPLFAEKIKSVLGRIDRVLLNLARAQGAEAEQKRDALAHKRNMLEEVLLTCN